MWLTLNVNLSGALGTSAYKAVLVNMDQVKLISPKDDNEEHSKLTFVTGETKMVKESMTKIEAMLSNKLDTSYVASEPKAP